MDIKPTDRVVHGDREFVVAGVPDFTDALGQHFEVRMREVASSFHEEVIRKTLLAVQPNKDELFEEWSDVKAYGTSTLKVLIDPVENITARDSFIQIIDPGKLEQIDYVMTVDLPTRMDKAERIFMRGNEYEIMWILDQDYETFVGLKKSMVNY